MFFVQEMGGIFVLGNEEHVLFIRPRRAGLETFYATLLISTRTLHGCSFLENAGAHSPE